MDLPVGNEVALNGTTAVTALAAPASGKQRFVPPGGVTFYNEDTVAHVFTLQKKIDTTVYVLEKFSSAATLATVKSTVAIVLDDTDEIIEVVSDATATTTEPSATVAAMETS